MNRYNSNFLPSVAKYITPAEFFDPDIKNPSLIKSIFNDVKKLSDDDLLLLSTVLKRITKDR